MKENIETLDSKGISFSGLIFFAVIFLVLGGLIYPTATTLITGAIFSKQANGSLIEKNGKTIGSSLVGQKFVNNRYFIGRPSNAGNGYDPTAMSGSNLAPSNPVLRQRIEQTAEEIKQREQIDTKIPIDLLSSSGSGIDPDISPAAARFQAPRIAMIRGLSLEKVLKLIDEHIKQKAFGFLGQARVNVLELNLALEDL